MIGTCFRVRSIPSQPLLQAMLSWACDNLCGYSPRTQRLAGYEQVQSCWHSALLRPASRPRHKPLQHVHVCQTSGDARALASKAVGHLDKHTGFRALWLPACSWQDHRRRIMARAFLPATRRRFLTGLPCDLAECGACKLQELRVSLTTPLSHHEMRPGDLCCFLKCLGKSLGNPRPQRLCASLAAPGVCAGAEQPKEAQRLQAPSPCRALVAF